MIGSSSHSNEFRYYANAKRIFIIKFKNVKKFRRNFGEGQNIYIYIFIRNFGQ